MANQKFDVSLEIVNFEEELRRVEREVYEQGETEVKARIAGAVNTLREVTPVDTGRARDGWFKKRIFSLYGYVGEDIINNVEYVPILNRGTSKQAPSNFIERVLMKYELI